MADVMNKKKSFGQPPEAKRPKIKDNHVASVRHMNGVSDGFSRGAVIKLHLNNFLTFDDVIIHPKPQLNVIVGPNGTGKSSIVCAICLGLAGPTSLLGRAKDVSDFVKHGKNSGFVEITLYDDRVRSHPVIRRTMYISSNSSEWTINRGKAKEGDVKKLVQSLNIQLDNRCMFLPQDKVVEFARMNKQELLLETERAIDPNNLYKSHMELKQLKSDHSQSYDSLKRKKKELIELQRQNKLLERDVERFKNEQSLRKDIKLLTLKKYWVQYHEAYDEYNQVKKDRKEASKQLKENKDAYQPIKDSLKTQEDAVERHKELAQRSMRNLHQTERALRDGKEKLNALEDKLEEPIQELQTAKKQEANRKRKIEALQREIAGFRKAMDELEPVESLNPKIAEKNRLIREIQHKSGDIVEQQRELARERQQHEELLRNSEEELRRMDNIWTQRLQKVEQRDRQTATAIKWLKNNQHLFSQPILEPVCMSVNIRNPCYAKQVEAFFGGRDFFSFVAQNEGDKEKFLREVRDTMRLKINVVRAPHQSLRNYKSQISFDDLQRYGFKDMLLNVVEAPEPVLCHFCQYHGLHQIPIAGNLGPAEIERITTQLTKLRSFFTADSRYSVKKSLYRNAISTRSNILTPPRFLVESVDAQRKEKLEIDIERGKSAMAEFDQRYQELEQQDLRLRQKDAKLRTEKQELRKMLESRKSIRSNITSRETKLEQCLATTFDLEEAERRCNADMDRIQGERVMCLARLLKLVHTAIGCTDESLKDTLNVKTAEAKVDYLLRQFRDAKTQYDDAEQRVKFLQGKETASKEKANICLNRARRETGVKQPEDKPGLLSSFQMFPDKLDAIEDLIQDLQVQANMCQGADQLKVDEFKEREKVILRVSAEVEKMEKDLGNRDNRIRELKEKWLKPLEDLLEQVNKRFRSYFSTHTQMECAGEVKLDPDPREFPDFADFDKFGVQIKVKFRDTEQLQELNAQRQSGGERSVSTMLYLMALQGNTTCPFRVVDEINQGMDPVNERHIFNLIVQSACHGAQYFLLTPKLLQNLEYSEAVSVHLVNNGQEMMSANEWNLKKILS